MAIELAAWQHIYASVEREQSPWDRGGFQTLFYTRSGLTESEVREMEARLAYFPSDVEAVKRLFFTTSTGKVAVAQIVHLAEPDRLGRRGRYLAHNLVFCPEAFARIESSPFLIFRQFPFITTVAEALEKGDRQTGDVAPVSFHVTLEPAHALEAARAWSTRDLQRLAMLALRADRVANDRLAVAVMGEPAEVERALEAAFLAVPTPLRARCSFDTYFHRCNLVDTYYWALGLLESPGNRRLFRVDAHARQLEKVEPGQPESAYERWVAACIGGQELEHVNRYRDHAFALCEWLEGRAGAGALIGAAPREAIDAVSRVNREQVRALLSRTLEAMLPAALARRVSQHLCSHEGEGTILERLRSGFPLAELPELLVQAYGVQDFSAPRSVELEAVDWLLQRADHVFLRLLHICWTHQWEKLYHELQLLDEEAYRQFVRRALGSAIAGPWTLPVPGRGDAFLDEYLGSGTPVGYGLVALVRALLRAGEMACLVRLAPHVQAQPEQELRALAGLVAGQPGVPEPFRRAVDGAAAALPPRKGFLAQLLDR